MREEEIKQLEIDKIHWRDLYREECEKNKKLEEENRKLKRIIGNIVYLYKEEPTELEEYVKSGFKCGMSN